MIRQSSSIAFLGIIFLFGSCIKEPAPPMNVILETTIVSNITPNTASTGGKIIINDGIDIIQKGICWSTSANPTIANNKTQDGIGIANFTSSLTGLIPLKEYYIRAYATSASRTYYGNQITFTTSPIILATITTNSVTSLTSTSALCGGNIISDGGGLITQRGVCWSTTTNPTILNFKTNNGTGTGSFTSNITGLNPNTTYYVKAYATNTAGPSYGNQFIFTTNANLPTLTTNTPTTITQTSSISGGNITNDGGAAITQRGVCWSTTTNPTISNFTTNNGTGTGSFTSNITGLNPNTTYYVRAYAINTAGTSYGNPLSFNTLALGTPTLTSPSNGSTISCCNSNRTFSWFSVTGATSYEINISRSSSFTGTTTTILACGNSSYPSLTGVKTATTTNTSFCINPGLSSNNGTWYWRVRAINGSIQGSWSTIYFYNYTF